MQKKGATWVVVGFLSVAALALAGACSSGVTPSAGEETHLRTFTNGGFETGTAGAAPPSWTITPYLNNGITVSTPETRANLDLLLTLAGHSAPKQLTTILNSATGPQTQPDPDLGATASLRWPRYGNQCAIVNDHSSTNFDTPPNSATGNGQNVNSLAQTMTIGTGDVDPADGKVHVRFVVAPVLQNPAHAANQQPYYYVQLTDVTQGNAILYQDFNLSGAAGIPWKTIDGGTANEIDYTDWQLVDISPGTIAMGDQVELELIASGCSLGGHFGEIYVDGVGSTVPGLFVSGTGPSQANACSDITYTLTYENGGTTSAAGVQVTFNTPPQTTFESVTAPGLACTSPAIGAAGAVVCTVPGLVAASASGSFQVTVAIACAATGTVTAGDYYVQATGITPLLGPHVNTIVGCTLDSQCATGDWCDVSLNECVPKLANGTAIPTDPDHGTPAITGSCTAAAGAVVCTSGTCDPKDNKCGFVNADGPCNGANASVVCRSGVCDPNGTCGYANGDGPCNAANGAIVCDSAVCDLNDTKCGYANGDGPCSSTDGTVVCRSTACSADGDCEPAGGCNIDADCTTGNWCDEATHVCTAELANGTVIPTDPNHTAPTLDGACTAPAATLVCASGVCDPKDNKCGYANGDGPCTTTDGPTDCRSGDCSATGGVCIPPGGCADDADCTTAQYCDTPTSVCVAKVANGSPVPTVAGHAPSLDGTCTAAAGAAACVSGVCDTSDNDCGYANGDGPCTNTNGATVCRSTACSTSGTCEPAGGCNTDADCTGGDWCDEATHVCTPQLANGTVIPTDPTHTSPTLNGTCTTAAATLVCVSGVCDPKDDKCGYANGDGPCTATDGMADCRSMLCATTGASSGLCVACLASTQCSAPTPVCNTTTDTCVQCATSSQCPASAPICGPTTGTCTTACTSDAECSSADWCDIVTGTSGLCTAKIANGQPLPTMPASVATCTTAVGARVCVSGVCDPNDNDCGPAVDGGKPDSGKADAGKQDASTRDASLGDAAADLLPLGASCTRGPECESNFCSNDVCSETISSGDGLVCAVRNVGSGGAPRDGLGFVGALLGLAGVRIGRRRGRVSSERA